jgi:hypothetical protein
MWGRGLAIVGLGSVLGRLRNVLTTLDTDAVYVTGPTAEYVLHLEVSALCLFRKGTVLFREEGNIL